MKSGTLYIISAPSGAGKTSLVKKLTAELEGVSVSVSHTTRLPRPGEANAVDYFFVDKLTFENMIQELAFLEYAQVFGNYYGTSETAVRKQLQEGLDIILEIDWQGAQQIKEKFSEAVTIFILPPSTSVLEQRLKNRGQDSQEVIEGRMKAAVAEMKHFSEFDYLIVNDDFNIAFDQLRSILLAERVKQKRQVCSLHSLLNDLIQSEIGL